MAEVILERNEMQKIRSYGEKHHEGPAFGRTPDDDDDPVIDALGKFGTYLKIFVFVSINS